MRHIRSTTTARPTTKALVPVSAIAITALLAACGGSDDPAPGEAGSAAGATTGVALTVLIASSGDAETEAVTAAATAWAEETGNTVDVAAAQDMQQQLAQGFAGGNAPDLFYVEAGRFADYASAGNLYPYVDQLTEPDDFYENLRTTFTFEDEQYCAPKDFSTLALQINNTAWEAAGLTDADLPTTWEELSTVAAALTTGDQVGLAVAPTRDRLGAFLVQAGGYWANEDSTEATAESEENTEALSYVQQLLADGSAAYPVDLDAGWGGEAFGTGRAAMAMEGNWIRGAMENDYPEVDYQVAEFPEGPAGQGTLLFTQCWGISADSPSQAAAVDLVDYLTTPEQQLANAEAFGVMPSRESAQEDYVAAFPDDAPFIAGAEYGRGPVVAPGIDPVLLELDAQLEGLREGDPGEILATFDSNAGGILGG